MEIAHTVSAVRAAVQAVRAAGRRIAFVPTMGALHAGHVSLMEAAGSSGAFLVASIYVNPTQFGPGEDFTTYPRTLDADARACERAGVEVLFAPEHSEIYPPGDETRVRPGRLAESLCGPFRPGHFEGVCTVVAKLFHIVQPDVAWFGQKDAQQAAIIRRMVADLAMPIQIEVGPIVRESDGLAMSSRNARLSAKERAAAPRLYLALCAGRDRLQAGETSTGRVIAAMRRVLGESEGIRVDYLSLVDPDSLEDLAGPAPRMLLAGAIRIGDVRLIDNLLYEPQA